MPAKKFLRLKRSTFREVVMVLLAIASIALLIVEVYTTLNLATVNWLGTLDVVICLLFLSDFVWHFGKSKNKKAFIRKNWIELIAALPITAAIAAPLSAVSLGASFTLLHLFRIVRLIIRIRMLLQVSLEYTKNAYLIYIFTSVSFVIFSGAGIFYYFEHPFNAHVKTYWDAVWWAIVTSTTIGYGDIYPITTGGRIIAIVVMILGITALGTFIAAVDSLIIGNKLKKLKAKN